MRYLLILIASALFLTSYGQTDNKKFYGRQWLKVYRLELKELPKSALSIVDSIYDYARDNQNDDQRIKALLYQSKFALTLEEDAQLTIIQRFKNEISKSKGPVEKAILHHYLAEIYRQYFTTNRWKIYNRTKVADKIDTPDFRTWDVQTLLAEIHSHYQQSLIQWDKLKNVKLSGYSILIEKYKDSDPYRPTLLDLLVHGAIDFYKTDYSNNIHDNRMGLLSDTLLFAHFADIKLSDTAQSSKSEVLSLYLQLLKFHQERNDINALVALNIERLGYVFHMVTHGSYDQAYLQSLHRVLSMYNDHPASTLVQFAQASYYFDRGYKPEALKICKTAINQFPDSDGALKCRSLEEHILAQSLSITTELFLIPEKPSKILINYTNIDSLHFNLHRLTQKEKEKWDELRLDSLKISFIGSLSSAANWSTHLINPRDYESHTTEVVVPALERGTYLIYGSPDKLSLQQDPVLAYGILQVTNMALIETTIDNQKRFQLVDRNTGSPLEGGKIQITHTPDRDYATILDKTLVTNVQGFASFPLPENYTPVQIKASMPGDTADFGKHYINRRYEQSKSRENTYVTARAFLFTDRSIYRPGQTVYFKGILLKKVNDQSSVVAGKYIEVYLDDVNEEEIGFLRLKTNEFGSFSGEFKIPDHGLNGEYILYADEDSEEDSAFYEDEVDDFEWNEHYISVEEYKRPTFEASFEPVEKTYSVDDSVHVTGKAKSFSGANISNAKVAYSVQRIVQYPYWWHSRHYSSPVEITSGETTTDQKGDFSILFKAAPDEESSKNSLPVFTYEITADITDISGETCSSSTTVKVGYHTLSASLKLPERINIRDRDVKLIYDITNLNGQHADAQGKIEIYKLQAPSAPLRERPWPSPELPLLLETEYNQLFPHEPYEVVSNWKSWSKGDLYSTNTFDSGKTESLPFSMNANWPLGAYVAELSMVDDQGNVIMDKAYFKIFDTKLDKVADNQLIEIKTDKNQYTVGEKVKLRIGTASKDLTVVIEIDKNRKIQDTQIVHLSDEIKELSIDVKPGDTGGFAIHYYFVNYNSFESGTLPVSVHHPDTDLQIETLTFRDKLQPGAEEMWSFKIKGNKKERSEVEFLTSMYDASLDQFKLHDWTFNPNPKQHYYSYNSSKAVSSFGTTDLSVKNLSRSYYRAPFQHHVKFNWFGFNLSNSIFYNRQYLNQLRLYNLEERQSSAVLTLDKSKPAGHISGVVTSVEDDSPLPGVNVVVKGTTRGTVTDISGYYAVPASKDDVLVFSFIGLVSLEVSTEKGNVIDVQMAPDVQQLSEVVVTAYGEVLKKDLLSMAVEEEFSEEVALSLEGKVAGMEIRKSEIGGASRIMLRGKRSISEGSNTLFVVDGVIVQDSDLPADDIASMELLTGVAATALYGDRAAQGVVIITTKSGQKKLDEMLSQVKARSDLRETAFFYPHLRTNKKGEISFNFTTPEALTRWKLQLLAHTKDLKVAHKTLSTITQKELMVVPNAPRFLRKGDKLELSAKIINLTTKPQQAQINLQLSDATTGQEITAAFLSQTKRTCSVPAEGSNKVTWTLEVPNTYDVIQYKIVATTGDYSDGEQNVIPILSNRQLVTETLPMTVKGNAKKQFVLEKLVNNNSSTLEHHKVTLEVTSDPIWYAIKSLPYLMEFPYECSEQTFARFYANMLAEHIVANNLKIKEIFAKWKSSGALISNLEKNQELKSILIQETPWLRDAKNETEQQKRIALLFDLEKVAQESKANFQKLAQMQFTQGGFPWFSGNQVPNRYITQHILAGLGHLERIGVATEFEGYNKLIKDGIGYIDSEIISDYETLLSDLEKKGKGYLSKNNISNLQVQYLYTRSFFNQEHSEGSAKAYRYYLDQSASYWTDFELLPKAMIALVQRRAGNKEIAAAILESLKETSIISEELGMYWKANKGGYQWTQAAIETQSLIIEAFHEIEADKISVNPEVINELNNWLLKHKQVNKWETTKATTEAIYALLLNKKQLSSSNEVAVQIGKEAIAPEPSEAGTGYFKKSWNKEDISSDLGLVTLSNEGDEIVWGSMYWQYFEDLDKISKSSTKALALSKRVFKITRDAKGEVLNAVNDTSQLQPGDLLRIRIELKADRDMEFMHMKDQRASGLEPVTTLSEYKWQDGLGYYESTKDASTNFFFDKLPKGVYVFEYDLRVNNAGVFSNGITTIQSMYAPEFSSHSEAVILKVIGEE